MVEYIQEIVIPYCCLKRKELKLPANCPALVLFDVFKGQCTEADWSLLERSDIHIVTVPANMAGKLQPLVVSVNKAAKDFLRGMFKEWYAEKVVEGDQGIADMRLAITKPISARWIIQLFDYMKASPDIIKRMDSGTLEY